MNVEALMTAFSNVFSWQCLGWLVVGVVSGIILGALPGISTNMAISLLFSFCYTIKGTAGVIMLLGVYCGGIYGGSISAILLNTPGTPANAATLLDGHPMARKGEAGRALGISTMASSFGGLFSAVCLIFFSTLLAKVSLKFTSLEYCSFAIFGISIISSLASQSITKGLIGGLLGLMMACIGVDSMAGTIRFNFGTVYLMGGLPLIPLLIGLFAFSQVLISVEEIVKEKNVREDNPELLERKRIMSQKVTKVLPSWSDIKRCFPVMVMSSTIGTLIGAIPGTGGDISSFVSYNFAKRTSRRKNEFGTGVPEGVAAPEAGNNSVSGGAMIPMLSLGIPGDSCTAMLLGALMVKNISPGPTLFSTNVEKAYEVFSGMILSNLIMLVAGFIILKFAVNIVRIQKKHLVPIIVALCFVGTYSFNHTYEDLIVMLTAGFVGYFLVKNEFTLSSIIIGFILGTMTESNFRRFVLVSGGNFSQILKRPIAVCFFAAAIISLFSPSIGKLFSHIKNKADAKGG